MNKFIFIYFYYKFMFRHIVDPPPWLEEFCIFFRFLLFYDDYSDDPKMRLVVAARWDIRLREVTEKTTRELEKKGD